MDGEFDVGAAVSEISSGLGLGNENNDAGAKNDSVDDFELDVASPRAGDTPADGAGDLAGTPGGEAKPGAEGEKPAGEGDQTPTGLTPPTAPKTWRPEAAAEWAKIPPGVQAEILKREDDMFKGLETYKVDAGFGKQVKAVLDPFMPILNQYGIQPEVQIRNLMNAHYQLATGRPEQKTALFQQLARDYNVDLAAVSGAEAPYIDPTVKALQDELQAVKTSLSEQSARELAQQRTTLRAQIDAFATDTKNVHFETVGHEMAVLLQSGVCKTLPEAYEKAVWANPVTRGKEQARLTAETEAKTKAALAEKAAAAQKAMAANVRTRAKSGSAAAPLGSMDDTLNDALASIRSRG